MWLRQIKIDGFRNIQQAHLELDSGINLLSGSNGSGKSSFLEAIQILSNGRSFRTNKKLPVINHDSSAFSLYGEISNEIVSRIGLSKQRDGSTIRRFNGRNLESQSEATLHFPLTGITPESGDFFTEGAKHRQTYIDWTLFHVEPNFHKIWKEFRRTHQQRNILLRTPRLHDQIDSWDESYIRLGEELSAYRQKTVERVLPILECYFGHFLPEDTIEVRYKRGWSLENSLAEALSASYQTDTKLGYTHCGPQRADLQIKVNGITAADVLSRGQRKLIHICLKLAQIRDYIHLKSNNPVFYIDDLTSELDTCNTVKVIQSIKDLEIQAFVTTPGVIDEQADVKWINKMFHVKQGRITIA